VQWAIEMNGRLAIARDGWVQDSDARHAGEVVIHRCAMATRAANIS
jgi:hypothetical protein